MELTIKIDMDTPQAKQFVQFVRTLPFVKIEGKWNQAIADGAVTVEQFVAEGRRLSKELFRKEKAKKKTIIETKRA